MQFSTLMLNWIFAIFSLRVCADCGGTYNATVGGTIKSPNYPNNYPNNKRCNYLIQAPPGSTIVVKFEAIDLQTVGDCRFDYVIAYDVGKYQVSPNKHTGLNFNGIATELSPKLCGTSIPADLVSTGNTMLLVFRSDHSVVRTGFQVTYSLVCGGTYKALKWPAGGEIKSPNYPKTYPNNADCRYLIQASPDFNVRVRFQNFHLWQSQDCSKDYITAYDGNATTDIKLSSKLCGTSKPADLLSTGNSMLIVFKSDHSGATRGFYARLYPDCDNTYNATFGGQIKSPNYPNKYPNEMYCKYWIKASPGFSIRVTFEAFDVERGYECGIDYVRAYNVVQKKDKKVTVISSNMCGSSIPDDLVSTGNHMLVVFITSSWEQRTGFLANYSQVPDTDLANNGQGRSQASSVARMNSFTFLVLFCFSYFLY